MKKYLYLFIFVFANSLLSAQWISVFDDEFNEDTLDLNKWYNIQPWGQYDPRVLPIVFLRENVSLKNGYLLLTLKEDHKTPYSEDTSLKYSYSAGMIWSKKYFKYGIFEARIKIPNVRGVWSAFWLYGSGQYGDEIDIFEQCPHKIIYNNKKDNKISISPNLVNLAVTIHNLGEAVWDNNIYDTSFLHDWHTYKLIWDDKYIKIYIDDEKISAFKKSRKGYI